MLPASLVTKKDRYPFPDTAAERAAAGSDPASEFFASGYDPDTGKGNMNGGAYYRRHEYDGTREMLRTIGLEVRFGGFGKVPPTVVGTPKKGEKSRLYRKCERGEVWPGRAACLRHLPDPADRSRYRLSFGRRRLERRAPLPLSA